MIAITTPTGNIGSKVMTRLLDHRKLPLRVLVRDPGKLAAAARENIEIVEGSLDRPADLRRLLAGAECQCGGSVD